MPMSHDMGCQAVLLDAQLQMLKNAYENRKISSAQLHRMYRKTSENLRF